MTSKSEDRPNPEPKERYVVADDEYQKWLRVIGQMFRMLQGPVVADMASRAVRTLNFRGTYHLMSKFGYYQRLKQLDDGLARFQSSLDRRNVFMGGPKWSGGKNADGTDRRNAR